MRFPIIAAILFAATFAIGMPQSPFIGEWQTRVSRVTHKSEISVNIVNQERGLGGTVVLVNPDASEIQRTTSFTGVSSRTAVSLG